MKLGKHTPFSKLTIALLAGFALNANAAETQQQDNNWPYALGFYVGGQLGQAKTDVSSQNLDSLYSSSGLSTNSSAIDRIDTSYSLFVGYRFNEYFSVEGGYQDLGDRAASFSGTATNLQSYYVLSERVYPETADGISISVLGTIPLEDGFTLTGKLGYYDWEMDAISSELSGVTIVNPNAEKRSDSGIWLGGEVGYHINYNTQAYVSYQHIPLQDDDVNVVSVGFRYFFDDKGPTYKAAAQKPAPIVESAPVSAPKPAPVQPVIAEKQKPVDTDGDGVFDENDKCADTPINHVVDKDGCSQYEMKPVDMKVVILYDNNSSEINKRYYDELANLAAFIKEYNVDSLNVVGHTSASGPAAYNQKLSLQRAKAVATFLTERFGIDASIINAIGKGETELVSDDANKNRRMEVYIKSDVRLPILKD
ncbi:OmpA family protein [Psychrosphaera aestuarii]|uniref:OmpA family protein n=1 Tax=Psychrosphaera aestuarii TaxID=1266052 RepID=UPI001B31B233|nr:OmpA family protein [Psychrosphaera aestuarii]